MQTEILLCIPVGIVEIFKKKFGRFPNSINLDVVGIISMMMLTSVKAVLKQFDTEICTR